MNWTKHLIPFPGGNRRVTLVRLRSALKRLDVLVEAAINDEENLDEYWGDIVEETHCLKSCFMTKEERDWNRSKQHDTKNPSLATQVRERDGNICRYCEATVTWAGPRWARTGTYSHIKVGQGAKTPEDMVVACISCDRQRSEDHREGKELKEPNPLPA